MFALDRVTSVYSGRKGCACGCRGKYTYACKEARPSYYTDEDNNVNPRTVKMMVQKMERLLADPDSKVECVMVEDDFFAVDMENDRTYTVYFG